MPVLEIESYNIDFCVIDDNSPETLIILDKSIYLDTPEKPLLDVILPGFTGYIEVPYNYGRISLFNSDSLKLTEPCEDGSVAPLPDGVYQITMKICPYEDFNTTHCYLKTSQFNIAYETLLLLYPFKSTCYDEKDIRNSILDIDILIQSAKAEANRCNTINATNKYKAAVKLLTYVNEKINCM